MRVLLISDIHANLAAFEAVLSAAADQWDLIWFLGDLIGYGPDPNECVALLREHEHLALLGNHDAAVLGQLNAEDFNQEARFAIEWTRNTITPETQAYLQKLDSYQDHDPFTIAHASPRHPVWEYILDSQTAQINFLYFHTPYCFVGHTHVPLIFEERSNSFIAAYTPPYDVPFQLKRKRLIINPGSVGQPRDSDPRAAYALLDTEKKTIQFYRTEYPIRKTQENMLAAGLPERLIARLSYGW